MHITLRTWSPGHGSEVPNVSEPFFDPTSSRIGVFNGRYISSVPQIEWGPRIDAVNASLLLNQGQALGGVDSNGGVNSVRLDWSVPGHLRVVDASNSNDVLFDIGADAQTLKAAASVQYGIPGPINRLLNSGLGLRRRLIANQAEMVTTNAARTNQGQRSTADAYWDNQMLLSPNCFAWKAAGSVGTLTFSIDDTDVPTSVGAVASVKVVSTDAPNDAGVTFYDYDYASARNREVRPTVYLKGDTGRATKIRLRSEAGGVLAEADVTGTGAWVRVSLPYVSLPDDGSSWLAFDVLQQPGNGDIASCTWRAAAPQISLGRGLTAYETRTVAMEASMASSIYREAYVAYDGLSALSLNVQMLGFLPDVGDVAADYQADDGTVFMFPTILPEYLTMKRQEGGRVGVKLAAYLRPNDTSVLAVPA